MFAAWAAFIIRGYPGQEVKIMAAINGNVTRITGMTSGMDTDTLVKNLMKMEQLKVNRELRARTLTEWKQASLKSVAGDLKDFKLKYMSALSADNMLTSKAYVNFKVTTADTSGAVTVNANADNTATGVTVNEVTQLATATSAKSGGAVLTGDLPEGNGVHLGDLQFANDIGFNSAGNISFRINDVSFTFNRSDTLQSMINTVSSSAADVNMSYSRLTNGFTIEAKKSGSKQDMTLQNVTGNVFGENGAFKIGAADMAMGVDAKLKINGVEVTKESNSFTIDGIGYQLNKTTDPGADIKYSITKDIEPAVTKIKAFVDGYNTLVKKLDAMLTERKTSSEKGYTPLTEEEKAEMTEQQIKDWEVIAKKGLLNNDAGIRSVLDQLRGSLFETVKGAGLSPADVGITTGSYFDGTKGQIKLDEDRLRAELNKDANRVMSVFMDRSESADAATARSENGLMYRISNIMDTYTKGSNTTSLDSLGRNLTAYNKKISQMEDKMAELSEKYYLKFAAMEKAMSDLNSQSSWLSSMMGAKG